MMSIEEYYSSLNMKQVSEYVLRAMAYAIVERITELGADVVNQWPVREYYSFKKAVVPINLYKDVLESFGADVCDVMVEIAFAEGAHERLHYHKEAHAVNLVMGPKQGFGAPHKDSYIQAGASEKSRIKARQDSIVYFPKLMHHTFSGPEGSTITFLSIQSPPLERTDWNDYFWVDE